MGLKTVEAHAKYLGLPTLFGKYKKVIISQVIDRVQKKVKRQKEKFLSKAGKEVLIKYVAQAIPTYVMRCFKPLDNGCKEIEATMARFSWGSSQEEWKIH